MNSQPSRLSTEHSYYPLFLDISNKSCLVVGGGSIAQRKVQMLLKFNGRVKLVSPVFTRTLLRLSEKGKIEIAQREYIDEDLDGMALVFAATNRSDINSRIKKGAELRNIPVNVVDDPALCDFIVPSIVKKGPIAIAISTSGTLPLLSKRLRKEIDRYITKDYVAYAAIIGEFRELLKENVRDRKKRSSIMKKISGMDVKEIVSFGFTGLKNMFLKAE